MRQLTRHLYFWVLLAILIGGTIGYISPETGVKLKPLGDGFIALVKMLISPIIFCTVVLGIAGAGSMKKVGRAGGAMAFTIGRYGVAALKPLALLMGSFYLTCFLFVFIVLGSIAAMTGFNILRFISYIMDELLTVLGTSSSESALVPLMQKLER